MFHLDGKSTPNTRQRTTTNPNPSKQEENEKMPRLQPRNHPQYRSWDQSVVAVKRRKDTVRGGFLYTMESQYNEL